MKNSQRATSNTDKYLYLEIHGGHTVVTEEYELKASLRDKRLLSYISYESNHSDKLSSVMSS
ncbi:CLUMA_CG003598, isoform A [Clunio marinus]|uniref:CLUMA_CG003598, isoform A n=1 Tax=Clunio marinus TaxID=568069 RepID=A0A1J1HNV2_9DIPT|nr:CLUMA_CG003598, isoform A [Clunio marinus]